MSERVGESESEPESEKEDVFEGVSNELVLS